MNKHTQGPWFVEHNGLRVLSDDSRATIVCDVTGALSNPQSSADARLIAAAPELLYALEMMLDQFRYTSINDGDDAAIVFAKHAIAKAKGE